MLKQLVLMLAAVLSVGAMQCDVFAAEQEQDAALEDVLFLDMDTDIATKSKLKVSESPAIVTVITASQIREMGARTLHDVLNTIPGMYFSLPGSDLMGTARADYIRGLYYNHTQSSPIKLLINGTSLVDAYQDSWGTFNQYGTMAVHMIERIEVIRGPGSVVYGGSALAGVINIVTKSDDSNQVDVGGGTNGLKRGFVKVSAGSRDLRANAMASLGDSFITNAVIGRWSGTTLQQSSEKRELYNAASRDYLLDLLYHGFKWQNIFFRENVYNPFTQVGYYIADQNRRCRLELTTVLSSLEKSFPIENGSINSKVFYRRTIYGFPFLSFTPSNVPSALWPDGWYGDGEHGSEAVSGNVEFSYNGIKNQNVLLGYETLHERAPDAVMHSNMLNPNVLQPIMYLVGKTRNLNSIYVQDTLSVIPDKVSFNMGLRHDNYSDFNNGTANSPRIALMYKPVENYVIKALYGTAFRPPSFTTTGISPDIPQVKDDKNIKPEFMETIELALDCSPFNKTNVRLNCYSNRITNLIKRVPSDEPLKVWNTNVGNQKSWGVEGEAKLLLDRKSYIFANGAYCGESKNMDTGARAEYVPEFLGNAGVNYGLGKNLNVMVKGFYRSVLKPGAGDNRADIPSFVLFDTAVNYTYKSHNVYVSVYNMLDQEWKDPSISSANILEPMQGYGRRLDVGYRYMF